MRPCIEIFWLSTGAPVPERIRPSAIVHSNVAMFNSEQAARTRLTARISSDVSITMMGVEELISTLSRSSPSAISQVIREHRLVIRPEQFSRWRDLSAPSIRTLGDPWLRLKNGFVRMTPAHSRLEIGLALAICLTGRELLPYNKEFGPTRISL